MNLVVISGMPYTGGSHTGELDRLLRFYHRPRSNPGRRPLRRQGLPSELSGELFCYPMRHRPASFPQGGGPWGEPQEGRQYLGGS
jgi:hypothetical protein